MKKGDRILQEVFYRFCEHGERFFKQNELAKTCGLSLGTVNPLIAKLEQFGAIERKPLGFRLLDANRALLYWAVTRELLKDITYSTFVAAPLHELEAGLPDESILTAYSGYLARFGTAPADYDAVFVYANPETIERMFKPTPKQKRNLFVLTTDEHLSRLSENGIAPLAQIYVDLWQLGAPASRFVEELDRRLRPAALKALAGVVERVRKERVQKQKPQ
jgi:hypothetical protein